MQWVIYDSYAKDFAESEKEKEKEKDKKGGGMAPMPGKSTMEKSKKNGKAQANEELNKAYLQAWQILERMINQNIYDEIAQGMLVFELLRIPGVILHCALCLQIIATMKTHRTNFAKKRHPAATVEIHIRKNEENECDRYVFQHALLRLVCRVLWIA